MKITSATLIEVRAGPDKIIMETDLPDGRYPYTGNQSISMDVAYGEGEEYMKKHFPDVNVTVVKLRGN